MARSGSSSDIGPEVGAEAGVKARSGSLTRASVVDGLSFRQPVTACIGAATVVAMVAVAIQHQHRWLVAVTLVMVVFGAGYLSAFDVRHHRLPNWATGATAVVSTVGLSASGLLYGLNGQTRVAIFCAIGVTLFFFLLHLLAGLGMGDVKFAYTVGFSAGWFGVPAVLASVVLISLSGSVAALVLYVLSRDAKARLAYGPHMALGLVLALMLYR